MDVEIPCPRCGAFTSVEKVFCVRCGGRAIPLTEYDLTASDFIYPPDKDALESLKSFKLLSPIIEELVVKRYVRSALSRLSEEGRRISLSSELGSLLMECGLILGLKALPETYIIESDSPAAFTFGSDKRQFLVLSSGLLSLLNRDELKAAIGHELGHIKCEHLVYHTLAELLTRGLEFSLSILGAGLEALSPMFKLILLSWHRESEVSADRASLLVVGDVEVVKSALEKLSSKSSKAFDAGDSFFEIFSTHPTPQNRIKLLMEYYRSREYAAARSKLKRRLAISRALAPRCRYCGAPKGIVDLFCPKCGRSQI